MASMLRSGRFVRFFAAVTRNLVFNTHREAEGNVIRQSHALSTTFTQGFATSVQRTDQTLDRSIKKLDQDVRRTGRISRRDIEEVLEEIRLHRTASSSQSLLVIRCCGNLVPEELPEVRTALVQKIWNTLMKLNVQMDVSHYNALLRVYLENEHPFSPTEFLANLESNGIEPNRVTYQRLISRYCQEGDIDGATRILEFMRAKQHPINEHVFNALILGRSQADDIESAVGMLPVMKQSGIEPTADTYTVLLCAYAKTGKIDEILSTLDKCEENEIYLLDKDLFEVIYALSTNGHSHSVDKIIPRLRKLAGYNQDAVNLILRLVNKGQEDVAMDILKTMPRGMRTDGEMSDTGTFFIKQLVRSKRPADKVLLMCKHLQESGLNNRAFYVAAEIATKSGMVDLSFELFKEIRLAGQPIKVHYFWPLICAEAKGGADAVLDVLRRVQLDFGMPLSGETIRDYVIPNLKERNYEKIILLLRSAGTSHSNAVLSCVYDALQHSRIVEAANLASEHLIYYQPGLLRRPLVQALIKTNDYRSYISIIRSVYENHHRLNDMRNSKSELEEEQEIENNKQQSEVVGQFVYDAVLQLRQNRAEGTQQILSALVEQGLSMSKFQAERIQEKLGSLLTPEISTMLDTLTAGELEPVPLESRASKVNFGDLPAEHLEKLIHQKEAKGENVKGLYRSLLLAHFKANDIQKTEDLVQKLETTDFVLTSGTYAQLIELYCNNNAVDKALALYEKVRSKEPDFMLNDFKIIKLVNELVSADRIDEAVAFLTTNKRDSKQEEEHGFGYNSLCWRLLDSLAEKGRADDVTKMFTCLEQNNFVEINNVLLGPLVKVHLVNNDVTKALSTFEAISTKHNCTPWKNDLACKLIQMEDTANLQLLTDLSTNVHGEVNSLYDLVFSFIECGRIRPARKILETPGLRSRPQRINIACERYRREGNTASLEGLVEATRDLNHIDRNDIFYNLLLTYCKEDSPEKALGLWTTIQEEEDVTPNDDFLTTLASYLESKDVEVPFVIPASAVKKASAKVSKTVKTKSESKPIADDISEVKKALSSGKLDKAIAAIGKLNPSSKLSVTDESRLLELMVDECQFAAANSQLTKMIEANTRLLPRTFRYYLSKVADAGDYAIIENLSPLLSDDVKKTVQFDNRVCHAYITAGKSEEYLDQIIKKLNNATTKEELDDFAEKFPRSAISRIFDADPELISKFEKFAVTAAEKGIKSPINALWMHHVENSKLDLAKDIMKKYLINEPRILFMNTTRVARQRKDDNLVRNLLGALKETKVTEPALGNVHSCLIDVLCSQEKYDEALKAVDNAIKDVCLEHINRSSLTNVKIGLEKSGKKFPHKIPERKVGNAAETSSSSSSSSDDEPVKK